MAKETSKTKKASAKKSRKKPRKKPQKKAGDPAELAALAALDIAAAQGWEAVTLAAAAKKAGVPEEDVRGLVKDRDGFPSVWGRMIDRRATEGATGMSGDPSLSVRDRLFDLLMARFDVLNERRAGFLAVLRALKGDPRLAAACLPSLYRSMGVMLDAAGAEAGGAAGAVKAAGLAAVHLKTLRAWAEDGSPDMAATMAALDGNLGMAERWAARLPCLSVRPFPEP